MCGIVGYVGDMQAQPLLLECLRKLEYRGYDSCGIAIGPNSIEISKDKVRVEQLQKESPLLHGTIGIGHTRWATHGKPSRLNAHPHLDCSGRIAVVHNGVIANYQALRNRLLAEGHTFVSETDTEVLPHLVEKHFEGDLFKAVQKAIADVEGSYAIVVMMVGCSDLIIARKDSPLIIGLGDRGNFIASDVPAFLSHTNRVVYVEDGDLGIVTADDVRIVRNGTETRPQGEKVSWTVEEAQKGGYEHFMLKEIHEQPRVIRNTIAEYSRLDHPDLGLVPANAAVGGAASVPELLFLACGTSYNAALVGRHLFEELAGIPVRVEIASEFVYQRRALGHGVAVAITQSGETADTLKAMKRVAEGGSRTVAITNVVGSTASRVAGQTLYTRAGPEISVAATKSFTAQLVVLYLLAISSVGLPPKRLAELNSELRLLPSRVQQVLDDESKIEQCARYLKAHENAFFVARGINLPIVLEGALKLKETSYIHAEGLAAGEMKHHTLAVLSAETPVIAIIARDNTHEAMLTNIKEIKARGAPVIALAEEGDDEVDDVSDMVIRVPGVAPLFSPVVNTIALQLLAYYTSRERGCPIDFPRNLAKSVTVE